VRGTARLSQEGSALAISETVRGATPEQQHLQHIHLPQGRADGRCPTDDLDQNGDGLVSLEEGAPAYGAPAVSLEPFPTPEGPAFGYEQTVTVAPPLQLGRGAVVLHGMEVDGKYEATMPVACGAIEDAAVLEIALEGVNRSGVAGTARLSFQGERLVVWIRTGGAKPGVPHLQHVHVPEGRAQGRCPTPELDRDGDGLISLEEGGAAYGAPSVSLEPFPMTDDLLFDYHGTLEVPPKLPLDRGVIVIHGMDVSGKYDPTIPIACGAIP
jgi:hypothetical protein